MKQNSFWGTARSRGLNVGLIVRLGLTIAALAGSATLAWTLLTTHGARAAGVTTTSTAAHPWGIVFDSNGNVWVAEPGCNPAPACHQAPNGVIQEFNLAGGLPSLLNTYVPPGTGHFNPTFLQLDGAGHVWYTDPTNNAIGELTPSSDTWQEFNAGITLHAQPFGLVLDTNGNLWFAERAAPDNGNPAETGKIGYFNTATHVVVETAIPTTTGQPDGMTFDAAHNIVWFAEDNAPKIGSFTPTTTGIVSLTEHPSNTNTGAPNPHLVTLDSAGNVWFSEQGSDLIGEYNPATQTATHFSVAGSLCPTPGVTPTTCSTTYIDGIAIDSTGTVWFDETLNGTVYSKPVLGSLHPTSGAVTLFPVPAFSGPGDGLSVDSHDNVWVSLLNANQLGELPAGSLTATPTTPSGSPTVSPSPTSSPIPTLPSGPVNKTWYFAEGRVGGGFTEYLSLDNPTSNACTVDITYLYTPDRGAALTKTVVVTIPANSRYEEGVDGDLGTYPTGQGVTDSAIVAVDTSASGTPNCTGIVAERPMYYTSQGNGLGANSTSDVLGVTTLGKTFSIADVATGALDGGKFSSFITILNPPGGPLANVTASYYANSTTSGSPGTLIGTDQLQVPGGTRGTIFPNNHTPALPGHVSVVVTSDQPVAVERPVYFSNVTEGNAGAVSGGADVIGVQSLSKDWLFAEGYTGGRFQENFVIANLDPANVTATVTIKLELQTGPITEPAITIQPNSQVIWNVNLAASGQNVSAEITSTGANIVAEREMYFHYLHNANGRSLSVMGGSDVLGQVGPGTQTLYSFAEGYVNTGYDEWLTLQNPTATAETIWVTLYNALGHTFTFSINVPQSSRATVDIVQAVFSGLYRNGDSYKGLEVAMTVQATSTAGGPFVAERPMYSNVNGIQGGTDILGYTGG